MEILTFFWTRGNFSLTVTIPRGGRRVFVLVQQPANNVTSTQVPGSGRNEIRSETRCISACAEEKGAIRFVAIVVPAVSEHDLRTGRCERICGPRGGSDIDDNTPNLVHLSGKRRSEINPVLVVYFGARNFERNRRTPRKETIVHQPRALGRRRSVM